MWKGAQDWTRVRDAIATRKDWVYVVLTFAQGDWPNWFAQYREACPIWSKLRQRILRKYGKFDYIQTWERHAKKGIHCNLLIGNKPLWRAVKRNRRHWQWNVLRPMVRQCGFGKVTWVKAYKENTANAMAGYLTKLARELVGAGSKGQIPFDAPPHFRRLRASRGLLEPAHKSDMTGWLSFTPLVTDDGEVVHPYSK